MQIKTSSEELSRTTYNNIKPGELFRWVDSAGNPTATLRLRMQGRGCVKLLDEAGTATYQYDDGDGFVPGAEFVVVSGVLTVGGPV